MKMLGWRQFIHQLIGVELDKVAIPRRERVPALQQALIASQARTKSVTSFPIRGMGLSSPAGRLRVYWAWRIDSAWL
jgi:hypothetical protein